MYKVLVVMSTFNGEKYLSEQIDSILSQIGVDITLVIRDDGSKDRTTEIIKKYASKNNRIVPIYGRNIGFRKSFFNTLREYYSEDFDYYSFSDQDDVWMPEKLIKAIEALKKITDLNKGKLYASSLNVVDQSLKPMYINSFTNLRVSYGSALSRQRLAGCTMVFDSKIAKLCIKFDMDRYPEKLISHDGAVYYICLACGGNVYYDENSFIKFRRHTGTVTEHGRGVIKRVESITNIFKEYRNTRYEQNKALYETYHNEMTNEVKALSEKIMTYRNSLKSRLSLAMDKRIKCNLFVIDLVYWLAILLGCY